MEFNGDVMARALVRRVEINEAHERIAWILDGETPSEIGKTQNPDANDGFRAVVSTVSAQTRAELVIVLVLRVSGYFQKSQIPHTPYATVMPNATPARTSRLLCPRLSFSRFASMRSQSSR